MPRDIVCAPNEATLAFVHPERSPLWASVRPPPAKLSSTPQRCGCGGRSTGTGGASRCRPRRHGDGGVAAHEHGADKGDRREATGGRVGVAGAGRRAVPQSRRGRGTGNRPSMAGGGPQVADVVPPEDHGADADPVQSWPTASQRPASARV